jgi:hypothetical protein
MATTKGDTRSEEMRALTQDMSDLVGLLLDDTAREAVHKLAARLLAALKQREKQNAEAPLPNDTAQLAWRCGFYEARQTILQELLDWGEETRSDLHEREGDTVSCSGV